MILSAITEENPRPFHLPQAHGIRGILGPKCHKARQKSPGIPGFRGVFLEEWQKPKRGFCLYTPLECREREKFCLGQKKYSELGFGQPHHQAI